MGHANFYKDGSNNVICDQCGKKYKAEKLKKQWDGLWTCKRCWDYKHPQESVRSIKDEQKVNLSRPESTDVFTAEAQALVVPPFTYGAT
jgi:hypothetical protein